MAKIELTKLILETINTIAIVVGAIVATKGISSWKDELKGKTDYALARRFLLATYKVREAIKYVRNPFILRSEFERAARDTGLTDEETNDRQKSNRAVYSERWKKVGDAVSNISIEQLEAEISWGNDARTVTRDLDKCISDLFVAVKTFIEGNASEKTDLIIYDAGEGDTFNIRVDQSIKKVEDLLRPHLK